MSVERVKRLCEDGPYLLNTPIIQQVSVSVLDCQWSMKKRRRDSIERNRGKGQSKNIGVEYKRESDVSQCKMVVLSVCPSAHQ